MSTTPPTAQHPLSRRRLLGLALAAGVGAGGVGVAGCNRQPEFTPDGRLILRYMAWGDPEQLKVEQQLCDEFEKQNPHVHMHLFMVPGSSYPDKLQLMLASRTAPDIMRADHYYFAALARKKYFLPLDSFIAREPKDFLADIVPAALDEGRWDGQVFGMNVLFGPVVLYYNRALLDEAKLPDPYELDKQGKWDWQTFVEYGKQMTKRDKTRRPLQFGSSMPAFPQYASVIWNHGGEIMNADRTKMVLVESGGEKGIEELSKMRWEYQIAPTPADAALSAFTFESGKIGLYWGWSGETPRFRKNVKNFEWDIVPTPSGPTGNAGVIKGNQMCINAHTRHAEEAWQFVKFMTGPTAELLIAGKLRRETPARYSVQKSAEYLKADKLPHHVDVFLTGVQRGRILPIDWRYQEWSTEFNSAMDGLFNVHRLSVKEACQQAETRVNTLLASEEGF